jgi:hypothetical protein
VSFAAPLTPPDLIWWSSVTENGDVRLTEASPENVSGPEANVCVVSKFAVPKTVFVLSAKVLSVTVQPGVKKFAVKPLRADLIPEVIAADRREPIRAFRWR